MILGHLYVVSTTLTRPPKDKLAICVCNERNLFVWINTNPRPHGVGQFKIDGNSHGALNHESHLDCSRLTTFLPAELHAAQDRGPISPELASAIVEWLEAERPITLTDGHYKLLLDNLRAIA